MVISNLVPTSENQDANCEVAGGWTFIIILLCECSSDEKRKRLFEEFVSVHHVYHKFEKLMTVRT